MRRTTTFMSLYVPLRRLSQLSTSKSSVWQSFLANKKDIPQPHNMWSRPPIYINTPFAEAIKTHNVLNAMNRLSIENIDKLPEVSPGQYTKIERLIAAWIYNYITPNDKQLTRWIEIERNLKNSINTWFQYTIDKARSNADWNEDLYTAATIDIQQYTNNPGPLLDSEKWFQLTSYLNVGVYCASSEWTPLFTAFIVRELILYNLLNSNNTINILDVGCGDGS
eukprot:91412_1